MQYLHKGYLFGENHVYNNNNLYMRHRKRCPTLLSPYNLALLCWIYSLLPVARQ